MRRVLLFVCLLAPAAQAGELKIATWNMEWLTLRSRGDPALPDDVVPKTAPDHAMMRRYALALDADIVAVQEVDGPEAAAAVFPPDQYRIVMTNDAVVQRVGFAIRRTLTTTRNPDLVALDVYGPAARHRLRSGADITLDWPGGRLRLLAVHLKTGCNHDRLTSSRPECGTLRRQIPALQGWIAQRRAEGVPFVVLGDFNRRMEGQDDLLAALNTTAPLLRATEGRASPCWGGGAFIDHIMAGGAARGWMRAETLRVLVYKEPIAQQEALSDHCPVSVRFALPDGPA